MTGRQRWSDDIRHKLAQDMKKKYDAGQSIRSLAAEYECSYGTVRNYLLSMKTKLRKRGGGLPKRRTVEGTQTGGQA
ncbi:helix-turn-helix domain-containing protein [Streptomyces scabiei]|uniref:helix-turn-helix domain-containing protein n=1 Tax=Streptomyces scabiei TaxID=1930 RepID=UPI0038F7188A